MINLFATITNITEVHLNKFSIYINLYTVTSITTFKGKFYQNINQLIELCKS